MSNTLRCPVCNQKVDYFHIVNDHKEFWENIVMDIVSMPKTPDDFNKRFGIIGFKVEEF